MRNIIFWPLALSISFLFIFSTLTQAQKADSRPSTQPSNGKMEATNTKGHCGNGYLEPEFGEQCEDRNNISGDGCSDICVKEYCGNGYLEIGEKCDHGAGIYTVQGNDCDQYCQFIICGDEYVTGAEECDDGNQKDCDGCSRDCKVERPGTCAR